MAINKIIGAVAAALKSAFGLKVYQDDVEQGLENPCFYIALLGPSVVPVPGRGTQLTVPLDVHYFPQTEGDNAEMADMAMQLMQVLEIIPLSDGGCVRGTGRRAEQVDEVLHCMVTYTVRLQAADERFNMEELHLEENTNGS